MKLCPISGSYTAISCIWLRWQMLIRICRISYPLQDRSLHRVWLLPVLLDHLVVLQEVVLVGLQQAMDQATATVEVGARDQDMDLSTQGVVLVIMALTEVMEVPRQDLADIIAVMVVVGLDTVVLLGVSILQIRTVIHQVQDIHHVLKIAIHQEVLVDIPLRAHLEAIHLVDHHIQDLEALLILHLVAHLILDLVVLHLLGLQLQLHKGEPLHLDLVAHHFQELEEMQDQEQLDQLLHLNLEVVHKLFSLVLHLLVQIQPLLLHQQMVLLLQLQPQAQQMPQLLAIIPWLLLIIHLLHLHHNQDQQVLRLLIHDHQAHHLLTIRHHILHMVDPHQDHIILQHLANQDILAIHHTQHRVTLQEDLLPVIHQLGRNQVLEDMVHHHQGLVDMVDHLDILVLRDIVGPRGTVDLQVMGLLGIVDHQVMVLLGRVTHRMAIKVVRGVILGHQAAIHLIVHQELQVDQWGLHHLEDIHLMIRIGMVHLEVDLYLLGLLRHLEKLRSNTIKCCIPLLCHV